MSGIVDSSFYSSLNHKNVPYRAIVPDRRRSDEAPLRVLYLLHGLFGSWENWTDLTGLRQYARDVDHLIVMPDGGDNWYTDGEAKYESYLVRELLPEIETKFAAGSVKSHRAIAGNSMGGYGALKLGLKYPELFSLAASFSGAFHATRVIAGSNEGELSPSVAAVFGPDDSDVRSENDIFRIASKAAGRTDLPRIYFDCGLDDEFIEVNREFAGALAAAGIDYEFREVAGGHDWDYWDKQVSDLLSKIGRQAASIGKTN